MAGRAATAPHRINFHPTFVSGGVRPNALNAPQQARAANVAASSPKNPTRHPTGVGVFGTLLVIVVSQNVGAADVFSHLASRLVGVMF